MHRHFACGKRETNPPKKGWSTAPLIILRDVSFASSTVPHTEILS